MISCFPHENEEFLTEAPSYKVPDPVRVRFGKHLQELRTSRGITQMQLAMTSGLDRSFISDMERGVKEPAISTLEQIAIQREF